MYDIVTIGETMLRFSPDGHSRWEQAESLKIHVGGSESNTAVGLARLGMKVCWLSRLTNNDFGRRISRTIAAQGVDTQYVCWTDEDRVGTYYYEEGSPPRNSRVIYDRAASAFTQYTAEQLPQHLFSPNSAKLLHITGISLALGEKTRALINDAVSQAKQAGWLISFDVNYRARLWTPDEALRHCERTFEPADIVFVPRRDAISLWKIPASENSLEALTELTDRRGGKLTVMTMGPEGSAAKMYDEYCIEPITPVPSIGRLGGGDAFSAGFLYGWLTYQNMRTAIKWANAAAAVKYSIPGDLPLFHKHEVAAEVSQTSDLTCFR
jgi:2-dehydro-3-deoxygluconokinase